MNGMDFDLLGEARKRWRAFAISWEKLANDRVHLRSPGRSSQTIACICDLLGEARKRSRAFAISWEKLANHRVRFRSNATIFEQFVGELLAISPVGRAEGAVEGVGIRALDLLHRAKHRCTDI